MWAQLFLLTPMFVDCWSSITIYLSEMLLLSLVALVLILAPFVECNGKLSVAFVRYENIANLIFDGSCCDDIGKKENCASFCDLVFEVSVHGLDTNGISGRRPLQKPVNSNQILFPVGEQQGVLNPLNFNFQKWPGQVTIKISVYDQDENGVLKLVDLFRFLFKMSKPTKYHVFQDLNGKRKIHPTKLGVIFKYDYNKTYFGDDSGTDCLLNPTNPVCLGLQTSTLQTVSVPNHLFSLTESTKMISSPKTAMSSHRFTSDMMDTSQVELPTISTHSSRSESKTFNLNVTTKTKTEITLSQNSSIAKRKTLKVSRPYFRKTTKTNHLFNTISNLKISEKRTVSGSVPPLLNVQSSSTTGDSSTLSLSYRFISIQSQTDKTLGLKSSTTDNSIVKETSLSKIINILLQLNSSKMLTKIRREKIITVPSSSFPVDLSTERNRKEKSKLFSLVYHQSTLIFKKNSTVLSEKATTEYTTKPVTKYGHHIKEWIFVTTNYWPILVSIVLVALTLIVGITSFIYHKRKQELEQRQDIYNVTPKVLKSFILPIPKENGMTGKTEVALEVEQK